MLEYQSGIIFLATNRILDVDTALFSRVHIILSFQHLVPAQRSIWEHMAQQIDHDLIFSDFERLSILPLNGRIIQNALRVAALHTKSRERSRAVPGLEWGYLT